MRKITGRKQEALADGWRAIVEPDGTLKLHDGEHSIDKASVIVRIPPAAAFVLAQWLAQVLLARGVPAPLPPPEPERSPTLNFEDETDDRDLHADRGPADVALPGGAQGGRGVDGGLPELQPSRLAAEESQ